MIKPASAHDASRARFLRGDFRARWIPLRPPWAVSEGVFVERCTRCGECARRCAEGILVAGAGGFPEVDFSRGECTFCGECAAACEAGVLQAPPGVSGEHHGARPWNLLATISPERCIAFRGVVCRACGENCEVEAIRFRLAPGGLALPHLDLEACNGCGACVRPCPVQAVKVARAETVETKRRET